MKLVPSSHIVSVEKGRNFDMLAQLLGRGTELPDRAPTLRRQAGLCTSTRKSCVQATSGFRSRHLRSFLRCDLRRPVKEPERQWGFPFSTRRRRPSASKSSITRPPVSARRFCRCCGRSDRVGLCRINIGTRTSPCSAPEVTVTVLVPFSTSQRSWSRAFSLAANRLDEAFLFERSTDIDTYDRHAENMRSYLHGHSGISRASSRHSGGKGRLRESGADPGHGSARLLGRPRDPLVPGSRLQTHGPAGSGGRLSVIMRPRRLMGTSRRPPIGWPQRGPGVRRPHVPSGLLEPRPLCRSTSRQASVRETPNVEAPGCVPGRRTRLIAGRW